MRDSMTRDMAVVLRYPSLVRVRCALPRRGGGGVLTKGVFAAIEADDVGEEADLRGRPFAVGSVNLPVYMAGVNE